MVERRQLPSSINSRDESDGRVLMAELWHEWHPAVHAFIRSAVPNFHDGEDLLQQVAVAVARDFHRYDPDRPFIHWAIGIARNRVLHYRRSAVMSKLVFSQTTIESLADAAHQVRPANSDLKDALRKCIEKLQARACQILTLRYEENLKPREIAPRLGLSANTVSAVLHRTRKVLDDCVRENTR